MSHATDFMQLPRSQNLLFSSEFFFLLLTKNMSLYLIFDEFIASSFKDMLIYVVFACSTR